MISQVKKTTDLLHYHSRHDSLTGLYNHYALEQELLSVLKMTDNNCIQHALLSIDLDQFKLINDSIGHTAGDELLKMFSHHLKHDIPANMVLARVGAMTFFY